MNYLSKDNVLEVLSLSPMQQDMLHQTADSSQRRAVQVRYALHGDLAVEEFQQAWAELVAACPALRVVFRQVRNRSVQVVLKTRPIPLVLHDLRDQPASEQSVALAGIAAEQHAPFDPAEGPLVRLALLRQDHQRATLLCTSDPIALDDTSQQYLIGDLLARYHARINGQPDLETDRRPYREFLAWVARQDWTAAKAFWTDLLADAESYTPVRITHALTPPASDCPISRTSELPEHVCRAAERLADSMAVSVSAIIQTTWAILLHAYSSEPNVTFGLCSTGRPADLPGAHSMIGSFENRVPLQVQLDCEQQLTALVQTIQAQYDRVVQYSYLPRAEIESYRGGVAARGDVETMLAVYSAAHPRDTQGATLVDVAAVEREPDHSARLALEVQLGQTWRLRLTSVAGTLPAPVLDRMLSHIQTLLENITRRPEARIAELDVLPAAERHTVTVDFNQPAPAMSLERLAHQVIEAQVARQPQAIAAVCGTEQISYAQLNTRANRLAHWLRAQGFGRDDVAALFAERGIDMLSAILAVAKAGGAYLPLDPAYPDARLTTVLQTSQASVILTQPALAQRSLELADLAPTVGVVASLEQSTFANLRAPAAAPLDVPDANPLSISQPHDLANVFFTSGSTGQPKGAMVEHIGMVNHLWAKIQTLGLTEDCVVVQNASHCFDISVWQFLAPLMVGGRVLIYPNELAADPPALLAAIERDRATVLELVPTMIDLLLHAATHPPDQDRLPSLRYLVSTGEALPVALGRAWLLAYPHIPIVNAYGATECSDDTTHELISVPPALEQSSVAVGRPIANFKTYILDPWDRVVPLGCAGEICFTGVGVGRGYLNDPARSQAAFVRNPFDDGMGQRMYRTGDLGCFLPDGRLVYLSRLDHQVKVRGHRIELGEIEAVLLRHPAVQQSVAIVRPDASSQNQILAYVVAAEQIDPAELRTFLQTLLPDYMLPAHLLQLDALPLDRNGKVNRNALPEIRQPTIDVTASAPGTPTEIALAAIWADVLDLAAVSIDQTFFELGGHSLKIIQVRSRIKQQLAVDVSLQTLFAHQTLRQLAPVIDALRPTEPPQQTTIQAQPPAEHYPISSAQRRLWLQHQIMVGHVVYSMPALLELTGPLDVAALHQAFQTIVDRHASLRTTFRLVAGQPVQHVQLRRAQSLQLTDLTDLETAARAQRLAELVSTEARTGFDLEAGPLLRLRLVRYAADQHFVLINMHHIVSDEWSWQVLNTELGLLYAAFSQQRPNALPPLALQYTDYAHWQNERLASGQLAASERYWRAQLGGELPLLSLPTDRARPAVPSYAVAVEQLELGPELLEEINALGQQHDATLFMVLLAAVSNFLQRISGQQDLIVGSPVVGREQVELEPLIGFFINTIPLRIQLSPAQTFLELLRSVRQTALDAYAHQEYPFDQLVRQLNPTRDRSHAPIVSVMFQVGQSGDQVAIPGLHARYHPVAQEQAEFDLSFSFAPTATGFDCFFQYSRDLFDATTIQRFQRHFHTLLRAVVAEPHQPLASLPLLTAAERDQLLNTWNAPPQKHQPATPVHQLFEAQAACTPAATALVSGTTQLSYQALNERANQLARYLQTLGVGCDQRVAVCLDPTPELAVALLAILKAGGAYVPLDPAYPQQRLQLMLDDSQARVLLTERRLLPVLPPHQARVVCLDAVRAEIEQAGTTNPGQQTAAEQLAYIIYTSGSTGTPKGVLIPHRALANHSQAIRSAYQLQPGDRVLQFASLSFDVAAEELFPTWASGATVVLRPLRQVLAISEFLQLVERERLTVVNLPTPYWHEWVAELAQRDRAVPPTLRLVVVGSEQALSEHLATWRAHTNGRIQWINAYGPTETTITTTIYAPRWQEPPPGPDPILIGRPIANQQAYLLDAQLEPVPIGVPSELYIGGTQVARGYHQRPTLTAERFIPDPFSPTAGARLYRTGDLARYLPDGNIEFLGRIDQQIKLRGYRIELGEIEAALRQHPAVRDAVVQAREDGAGTRRLVAYVVAGIRHQGGITGDEPAGADSTAQHGPRQATPLPCPDPAPDQAQPLTPGALRAFLQQRLPEYMLPAAFVVLDELPLLPNGKLDRSRLPAPDGTRTALESSYIAPRDRLEWELTRLWEQVLQVQPVGVHDNFFALGGHSMMAMVLVNALRERLTIDVPLAVLFQAPTVAELALQIQAGVPAVADCLIALRERGSSPPLFVIHPQGGSALGYLPLVQALPPTIPVYGLQAVGYDSSEPPLWTVEAMAERYIQAIRRVAPDGPYRLAGWSFGGLVAFEMARQLEAGGQVVDLLGLLDVLPPDQSPNVDPAPPTRAEVCGVLAALQPGMDAASFDGLDDQAGLRLLLQRAQERHQLPASATIETVAHQVDVMLASLVAAQRYRLRGRVHAHMQLFRASAIDPERAHPLVDPEVWRAHTSGTLQVIPIAGAHHQLVQLPYVTQVAGALAQLQDALNQALAVAD